MTQQQVWDIVVDAVAKAYDVPPDSIRPETHFHDGLQDSMEHVELILDCEERLGIEIPDRLTERCGTLGQLVDLAWRLMPEARRGAGKLTVWPPPPRQTV